LRVSCMVKPCETQALSGDMSTQDCQQCPANMSSKARVAESVQTCAVPTLRNSRKLPNCKYFES
jgi:hypothetical protein